MPKTKVIVIIGPTASGKTSLAVALAKQINGEIISADSRQVYKGMDIGTGKDLEEYGNIPYHLIDVVAAGDEFTVSDFQRDAHSALKEIVGKNKNPIICGGTGHYVKALLEDYAFDHSKTDLDFTLSLESQSRASLYQRLKELGLWGSHHWENDSKRRIARAIEKKISASRRELSNLNFKERYLPRIYCLKVDRSILKEKIKNRLLQRIEQGMIEEVEQLLLDRVSHQRLERYGLEYKWVSFYLRGEISRAELIEKLTIEISRYAKRQVTFFRYMERCGQKIFSVENPAELIADAMSWLNNLSGDHLTRVKKD